MSQQLATSAQVIYETLVADTTFTDMLGEYEWASGGAATALSIVSPGDNLPGAKGVDGVECIINDVGNMKPSYKYDGLINSGTTWNIFLVAWGSATGADVQQAAEHLSSRFPGAFSLDTTATPDGLGAIVQTMVQVRSDMPILAA